MLQTIADGLYALLWDELGANNCNSFLLCGSKTVLIDPGHDRYFDRVLRGLSTLGLTASDIDLVLISHGHPDHLEAAPRLAPPSLLAMDRLEYEHLLETGLAAGAPNPDFFLTAGGLHLGDIYLDVLRTPGHTPGHLCFYWPQLRVLFSGDLLFKQGRGRTDLPGGSLEQLKSSLQRLKNLDIEFVLPGHGPIISGKEAVEDNFRIIGAWSGAPNRA